MKKVMKLLAFIFEQPSYDLVLCYMYHILLFVCSFLQNKLLKKRVYSTTLELVLILLYEVCKRNAFLKNKTNNNNKKPSKTFLIKVQIIKSMNLKKS